MIPPLRPDFALLRNNFGAHSVIRDEKENYYEDHKKIGSVDDSSDMMGQKDQTGLNVNKDQIKKYQT